jgi:Fe-S oxidoreductase
MPTDPIRQTFINIPPWAELALYVSSVVSVAVLAWGLWQRMKPWHVVRQNLKELFGARDALKANGVLGIQNLLLYVFGQKRLVRQQPAGSMHVGLFWGFVLLFIGTALATIDWDVTRPFNMRILQGSFYLVYELVLDIAGVVFIAALVYAVYRRAIKRPSQLTYRTDFAVALWSMLLISISGFLIEGLRLAGVRLLHEGVRDVAVFAPSWGVWSPVGYVLASMFTAIPVELRETLHFALWLFHAALSLVFVALMSWNENMVHVFIAPINTFLAPKQSPPPTLTPINLEEAMEKGVLGVSKLEEFTWQQRVSFDTCTMCGRCEAACPAFLQQTPLSPKRVILNLRDHQRAAAQPNAGELPKLIGEEGGVIHPDVLWSCTTCMACVQECPVFIPIVGNIIDMRRNLALAEGAIPASGQSSLRNVERAGNPWGQSQSDRAKWADGLGVQTAAEVGEEEIEVLYWVGCAGSYDARNQKVAKAVVKLLQAANIKFAILGREEKCVGDWQRRMGEEYQFQTLAAENIETMKQYKFKTVLAHCPHCFNTLKNDYPQFGGNFAVMHHSQFIARLIGDGRLKLSKPLAEPITFHDSCYLGRYNREFDAPRDIIKAIPNANLVEMPRARDKGLCCGGGGGQMWMEPIAPKGAKKVNAHRLEEAQAVGAKTIGVACSYCTIMMEDAVATKGVQEQVRVRDVAELVAESL